MFLLFSFLFVCFLEGKLCLLRPNLLLFPFGNNAGNHGRANLCCQDCAGHFRKALL